MQVQGTIALVTDANGGITDEASMLATARSIEAKHGAISVLVNNTGYIQIGPLEELTMEEVRCQFETNMFGLLRMCQFVLPGMQSQGYGRIINVSSMGGNFTTPGNGAYQASKYAVESFTDALRYEVQPFGVDVVSVQPTGVRTPFVEKLYALMPQTGSDSPYATFKQNIEARIQQMFRGNAWGILNSEDVAKVIVKTVIVCRPQTRYQVGLSGKIFIWVRRLLPDRAWDVLMSRMFPMGEYRVLKIARLHRVEIWVQQIDSHRIIKFYVFISLQSLFQRYFLSPQLSPKNSFAGL